MFNPRGGMALQSGKRNMRSNYKNLCVLLLKAESDAAYYKKL
jgi:hypothetical protein